MSNICPPSNSSTQQGTHVHRVCVAPMMSYTDRHFRYFLRTISRHTLLYTEMITGDAILNGPHERLLAYDQTEHPISLQLGGSEPEKLAKCARIAETLGYDEINLNAGCPSDRVQQGKFGACLMKEPTLVKDCLLAMQESVSIPVTLKTRIGVDTQDRYSDLQHFIASTSASGCHTVILHARKAWLQGLSPKENRTIPPLRYDLVFQLKKDFPHLNITLNGGIKTIDDMAQALQTVDGVMIGRQVCTEPYLLAKVDQLFYGDPHIIPSRLAVIDRMIPYIQTALENGIRLNAISRHLLGLFHGTPNAKQWRRDLSEQAHLPDADISVILKAKNKMAEKLSYSTE
jgi:tRNA-dihydrouridine synthase A